MEMVQHCIIRHLLFLEILYGVRKLPWAFACALSPTAWLRELDISPQLQTRPGDITWPASLIE